MIGPRKKRPISKKHQRHSARKRVKMKFWTNKIQTRWSEEGQCYKLNHRVCPKSGYYKGKQVMTVKSKGGDVIEA